MANITYYLKISGLIIVLLGCRVVLHAQIKINSFLESGQNQVSESTRFKNGILISFTDNYCDLSFGLESNLVSSKANFINAYSFSATTSTFVKSFPIDLQIQFLNNRYTEYLHVTNFGLNVSTQKYKYWYFNLGTSFKKYYYTNRALKKFNINETHKGLQENFGLLYKVSGFVKPQSHAWNICFSVTNFDYFLINQPTNPMLNIKGMYMVNKNLQCYLEAWHKQAGVLNIQANYFGYLIRGGAKWTL